MNNLDDSMINIKRELESVMQNIDWDFVGILDKSGNLYPIPTNIQVQALFEYIALQRLKILAKRLGCNIIKPTNTREYPDVTLTGGKLGSQVIAVDIKTARRVAPNKISGFTLGSYAGYFRNPDKKMPGCIIPYNQFASHWIIGFIYDWNENTDSLHMVSNIELIVQEKWKIASRSTGTGTTSAIGSIKDIDRLKNGIGEFDSEEEFLDFWRNR